MFYHHSTLGGTFDHLHIGHMSFIDKAFSESEKVTIGLSTETLTKYKLLSQTIESYRIRENNLIIYLKKKDYYSRTHIIPLLDFYGTTLKDETIEAVYVTEQTYSNAKLINQERKKNGLRELDIIKIPYVLSTDNKPVSSERIRQGEINREGKSFTSIFTNVKEFILPLELRQELRKPLGKLITGSESNIVRTAELIKNESEAIDPVVTITVGDEVTYSLIKSGSIPEISIIDFLTKRQKLDETLKRAISLKSNQSVINKPGTINSEFADIYQSTLACFLKTKKAQQIVIDGEEDLLTLSVILFSPLNSVVLYGLMDQGVVLVQVTEKKKKEVINILSRFTAVSGVKLQ